MLYYKDLEDRIFELPSALCVDCLTIVSGYVGIEPIKRLATLPVGVHATVIYGMYGSDNISAPLHKALIELQQKLPNVEILYSTIPVHSKISFCNEGDHIRSELIGFANFSVSG